MPRNLADTIPEPSEKLCLPRTIWHKRKLCLASFESFENHHDNSSLVHLDLFQALSREMIITNFSFLLSIFISLAIGRLLFIDTNLNRYADSHCCNDVRGSCSSLTFYFYLSILSSSLLLFIYARDFPHLTT